MRCTASILLSTLSWCFRSILVVLVTENIPAHGPTPRYLPLQNLTEHSFFQLILFCSACKAAFRRLPFDHDTTKRASPVTCLTSINTCLHHRSIVYIARPLVVQLRQYSFSQLTHPSDEPTCCHVPMLRPHKLGFFLYFHTSRRYCRGIDSTSNKRLSLVSLFWTPCLSPSCTLFSTSESLRVCGTSV